MTPEISEIDIVQRLRDQGKDAFAKQYSLGMFKLCAEAADEIERLRETHNRSSERTAREVRLQARPADGGDWIDIYPAQLGFVAKQGMDVQALEEPDPSYDAEIERLHNEKCDNYERAILAEIRLAKALEIVRWVETWVTNPVTSYSVHALDGLFGMTRDKIGAFNAPVSSLVTEKTDG